MSRRISWEAEQGLVDLPADYGKRKPDPEAEWRLQAKCAKLCFQRERADPTFRFLSPGSEGARSPARAAIAKMMGQNRKGVPDLWMFRINPRRLCVVEFKRLGGKLAPEQIDWFNWLHFMGDCHRCDNVDDFKAILAEF